MRVLWVNNIAIPQISMAIGAHVVPVGGWMVKLADELSAKDDIELCILFPYRREVQGKTGNIRYVGFVLDKKGNDVTGIIEKTIYSFNPNVIHIFGTECIHSYVMTEICKKLGIIDRVVISVQGLISICSRHYTAYLDNSVVTGFTARDILKGNIAQIVKKYKKYGQYEVKALQSLKHIIGRTDWDRAIIGYINPNAKYYVNNEMLRDSFYHAKWDINNCQRHSIFFSQATSPIKGLHLMIDALRLIKVKYPDMHLYIAGKSYSDKPKYKLSYYEKSVLREIRSLDLADYITFTGFLDEKQMCERYLKSNVFVSASSIENSPNSVCEAMILGVPVVSSMVGGIINLIDHGKNGFYYQADAPYMLAYYVEQVFENDELAISLSKNARKKALERHNTSRIIKELVEIYDDICKYGKKN